MKIKIKPLVWNGLNGDESRMTPVGYFKLVHDGNCIVAAHVRNITGTWYSPKRRSPEKAREDAELKYQAAMQELVDDFLEVEP